MPASAAEATVTARRLAVGAGGLQGPLVHPGRQGPPLHLDLVEAWPVVRGLVETGTRGSWLLGPSLLQPPLPRWGSLRPRCVAASAALTEVVAVAATQASWLCDCRHCRLPWPPPPPSDYPPCHFLRLPGLGAAAGFQELSPVEGAWVELGGFGM